MTETIQPAPEPVEPTEPERSRVTKGIWPRLGKSLGKKSLAFGAGGLVLGLLVGLPLGAVISAGSAPSTSKIIAGAVDACSATDAVGIEVLDNGASIELKTAGKDYDETGAPYSTVTCILSKLQAPDSLVSRMGATRALDGTLDGQWDGFAASWTYHPDSGLRVIVETARK